MYKKIHPYTQEINLGEKMKGSNLKRVPRVVPQKAHRTGIIHQYVQEKTGTGEPTTILLHFTNQKTTRKKRRLESSTDTTPTPKLVKTGPTTSLVRTSVHEDEEIEKIINDAADLGIKSFSVNEAEENRD